MTPPRLPSRASLAKITAPQLANHHPRNRLFKQLDQAFDVPVAWVAASPGMGKTTLAASYLDHSRRPYLWYSVDAGDADPASFFHYLAQAGKKAAPRRRSLPRLTPEMMSGLPIFTRHFFETLFERLHPGSVVVFDNFQDMGDNAAVDALLAEAANVIPKGMNFLVISRNKPTAPWSRLLANGGLSMIDWEAMRLTLEESSGIAALQQWQGEDLTRSPLFQDLHTCCDGWAAGLVLLLQTMRSGGWDGRVVDTLDHQALFDYFALEVYERATPKTRALLREIAMVPQITTRVARQLTGLNDAGRELAHLARSGFFIYRSGNREAEYQLHPLFRQFLISRAREHHGETAYLTRLSQVSALLAADGQLNEAAVLLTEAEDWEGLAKLICHHAPRLAEENRFSTLTTWLAPIPETVFEQVPWLFYWRGVGCSATGIASALQDFVRAYRLFGSQKQSVGMWLAWAGVADSYNFAYDEFSTAHVWVDELARLETDFPEPPPEVMARVAPGALWLLMWVDPSSPAVLQWEAQLQRIIHETPSADLRVAASVPLLTLHSWRGNSLAMKAMLDASQSEVTADRTRPGVAVMWWMLNAIHCWTIADFDGCEAAVANGMEIIERFGMPAMKPFLYSQGIQGALCSGNLARFDQYVEEMQAAIQGGHQSRLARSHASGLIMWRYAMAGKLDAAAAIGEEAHQLTREVGTPFPQAVAQVGLAQVYADQGDWQRAAEYVASVREIAEPMGSMHLLFAVGMVAAQVAHAQGDEAALCAALEQTFQIGRTNGLNNHSMWRADVASQVCAWGLERGIENNYVTRLIRERQLLPETPRAKDNAWPWQVIIRSLGPWQVTLDDEQVRFSHKAQRRPMALLKLIVAAGPTGTSEDRVKEAFWPNADWEANNPALRTTLSRLRKLLGKDVLSTGDGWIKLDHRRCWVDLWQLRNALGELSNTAANDEHAPGLLQDVMDLRRGNFLEGDEPTIWSIPVQRELDDAITRIVRRHATELCQCQRHNEAQSLFEWLLTISPFSEQTHRDLMTCHVEAGRRADALAVYERLRRSLAEGLKMLPSEESVQLAKSIRNGN